MAIRRRRLNDDEVSEIVSEFSETQNTIFMAAIENDMSLLEDVIASREDIELVRDLFARSGMLEQNQLIPEFLMRYAQQLSEHALLVRRLLAEADEDNRVKDQTTLDYIDDLRELLKKDANCKGKDPVIFHPVHLEQLPLAQRICATCIVRWECLYVGVYGDRIEETAVIGGVSPRVRKLLVKSGKPAATHQELRARLPTVDQWSVGLEYADWEYDQATKSYDNNVLQITPRYPQLGKNERIARAVLDKFRGQKVAQSVVENFILTRDNVAARSSDIPMWKKIERIPEFLEPGSVEILETGEMYFLPDGAYLNW